MSTRPPLSPALRSWIDTIWVSERPAAAPAHAREHSLPSGAMHLAVRLDGPPLRTYADADDRIGHGFEHGTVGGARTTYCIKDCSQPAASVGAILHPGAALALFGVSAAELEGRHVNLSDLCGIAAEGLYERLAEATDPDRRRKVFDAFLRAQLRPMRALDPQILQAAQRLRRVAPRSADRGADSTGVGFHDHAAMRADRDDPCIADLVAGSGRNPRRFIAGFRDLTGLTPKRYARVLRFKRLLQALSAVPRPDWTALALDAGYFDQPHLIREFREFTGVSPRRYLAAGVVSPHHLPVTAAS